MIGTASRQVKTTLTLSPCFYEPQCAHASADPGFHVPLPREPPQALWTGVHRPGSGGGRNRTRSEERRVGKEWRARGAGGHEKSKGVRESGWRRRRSDEGEW